MIWGTITIGIVYVWDSIAIRICIICNGSVSAISCVCGILPVGYTVTIFVAYRIVCALTFVDICNSIVIVIYIRCIWFSITIGIYWISIYSIIIIFAICDSVTIGICSTISYCSCSSTIWIGWITGVICWIIIVSCVSIASWIFVYTILDSITIGIWSIYYSVTIYIWSIVSSFSNVVITIVITI